MKQFPFLEHNLQTLADMRHPVRQWLHEAHVNLNVLGTRLVTTPTGELDLRMVDGTLFQGRPPHEYYQRWRQETDEKSATIIVGASLGHSINFCLTQSPLQHKVLVLEPDPDMLTATLGLSDYSEQLRAGRLHFLLPYEHYLNEFLKRLSLQHLYGEIHFRVDSASKVHGEEYRTWAEIFRNKLERFSAEQSTVHTQQEVMVENELTNFKRALSGGSLSQLKGSAKDMTALIFGAGPSLAEVGPALKEVANNALIMCGLQTMPALHHLGIKPDLCVAIDYTPSMLNVLPNLDHAVAAKTPLIYSTKVQPKLLDAYPGPKLPLWTFGGIGTKIMNGKEPILDAGSNVTIACRRILSWLRCPRVVFAGMDLAWLENKTHSQGHHAARSAQSMTPEIVRTVKGATGEQLTTSVQYLVAKMELEDDILQGGPETYNIIQGGAVIQGIPNISVTEALSKQLLSSSQEVRQSFLKRIHEAAACSRNYKYSPQMERWTKCVTSYRIKLQLAFNEIDSKQAQAMKLLRQFTRLLGQSAMFAPYFHKEIHELAEYTHTRSALHADDLAPIESILDAVMEKIRFADSVLTTH